MNAYAVSVIYLHYLGSMLQLMHPSVEIYIRLQMLQTMQ